MDGSPKFSVISLPTCHALETPPESPGACLRSLSVLNSDLIHLNAPLLLASIATRMSPSGWLTYEAESLKGGASPLRPMGCAVYASVVSFICDLLGNTTSLPVIGELQFLIAPDIFGHGNEAIFTIPNVVPVGIKSQVPIEIIARSVN